jgi:hypothetical protein
MMKLKICFLNSAALLLGLHPQPSTAQIKPCGELKDEITAKLEAKGVKSYTLTIIDKAKVEVASGKVVGSCENGTKKIIYARQLRSKVSTSTKFEPVVVVPPDPPAPASVEESSDAIDWEALAKEWGQCGGDSDEGAVSCGSE